MRYRALTASGDSSFGSGFTSFLVDTPKTVAQAVDTRLGLMAGEWWLDVTEGTPYSTEIIGMGVTSTYDKAIRKRISETTGVNDITSYSSSLNRSTRALTVSAEIDTIYGSTTVDTTQPMVTSR